MVTHFLVTIGNFLPSRTGINAWRFLANLTSPVSDGCAAVVDGRLWLVGGEAGVSCDEIIQAFIWSQFV